MLDASIAKKLFRKTLALLLVVLLWPVAMGLIIGISAAVSIKSIAMVSIIVSLAWVVLFIWLIAKLWKIGPQVGASPWGSLWLLLPFIGVFIVSMLFLEPLKYAADKSNLPLTWNLIKETWNDFSKHLKPAVNSAMWILYSLLIVGGILFLAALYPIMYAAYALAIIVLIFFIVWVSMKIFLTMFNLDTDGKVKGDEGKISLQKFWSMIWVYFLNILIVVGPVILAYILFITVSAASMWGIVSSVSSMLSGSTGGEDVITAIAGLGIGLLLFGGLVLIMVGSIIWTTYKSNQYKLVMPALLIQDKKGMDALRESARLIKNRWWGFFWKNLLVGLTAGALIGFVLQLVVGILLVIIALLLPKGPIGNGLGSFLSMAGNGAVQIVLVPFLLLFQVKLYKAFLKTAK